ncbi:MAG: ABC transporter ATP-binding protein, partial [Clostridia bacterium]|nr:ABC transporter ATP-binding protein [Clostridia bacterium]
MFRRMLNFARPWWGNLAVTVLSLIAASLLNLVTPEAVRRLTAALDSPDTLSVRILLTYAAILLGAYLVRVLFRFLAMWQAHIAA